MTDVSEKAVAVVEAENSRKLWIAVPNGQFIGEKAEVKAQATEVMNGYIKAGWPKDEIRVTVSSFSRRTNINSVDNLKEE